MKKRIICLALSVVMLMSILPLAIFATEPNEKPISAYGTESADCYLISSAEDLNTFIEKLGTSTTSSEFTGNFRITVKEIDYIKEGVTPKKLSAKSWFKAGTFDGNGCVIKGLQSPLFGTIRGTADAAHPTVIKNVTLDGTTIQEWAWGDNEIEIGILGLFVSTGYTNVENVHVVNGTINPGNSAGGIRVGGLLAGLYCTSGSANLQIKDCSVTSTTITLNSTAGLGYAGGLLGWIRGGATDITLNMENCINGANIAYTSVDVDSVAGGMTSVGYSIKGGTYTFKNCVNTGTISGATAAGIIGLAHNNKPLNGVATFNYTNCVNYGSITSSKKNAYGITGIVYGVSTLTNCANFGSVTATTSEAQALAVFGAPVEKQTVILNNCLNAGTLTATYVRGLMGYIGYKSTIGIKDSYDVTGAPGIATSSSDVTLEYTYNGTTMNIIPDSETTYEWTKGDASIAKGYAAAATFKDWNFGTDWMLTNGYPVPAVLFEATANDQSDNAIVYEGVQYTATDDGVFDVRFVTTISQETFDNAQLLGYEVVMVEAGAAAAGLTCTTTTVYKELIGYDEETDEELTYSAEDFGGDYMSAVSIEGVTASKTVTMIVRPWVLSSTNKTLAGTPVVCVFTNGELVCQYAY